MADESPIHWQLALLGRILVEGDAQVIQREGITLELLGAPEAQIILSAIQDYLAEYGQLPSPSYLRGLYPELKPYILKHGDPIPALVERVRNIYLYNAVQDTLEETGRLLVERPKKALRYLTQEVGRLTAKSTRNGDYFLGSHAQTIKDAIRRARDGKLLTVPYPWPSLQRSSGGMCNGEFIFYYGRPKSGKTWILLLHAVSAYLARTKEMVVVFTNEMGTAQLHERVAAILSGVSWDHVVRRTLTKTEQSLYEAALDDFTKDDRIVLVPVDDEGDEPAVLLDIAIPKIQEYSPSLVLLDSLYLFKARGRNRNRFENFDALTKQIKRLARNYHVPIVGISAASRSGQDKGHGTMRSDGGDVSFGDAGARDCDAFIRVEMDEKLEAIALKPKAREWRSAPLVISFRPAVSFDETSKYTADEVFQVSTKHGGAKKGSQQEVFRRSFERRHSLPAGTSK